MDTEKPESHVRTAELAEKAEEFEKSRQRQLDKERKVHAKRGSKPHAQQRVSADLPAHRTK